MQTATKSGGGGMHQSPLFHAQALFLVSELLQILGYSPNYTLFADLVTTTRG